MNRELNMNYKGLILSFFLFFFLSQPSYAQWISQYKEDPFGDNHIVGAFTAKLNKGLIVRCVGAKRLELMFLPNEMGSDEIVSMANLAGTSIKLRVDKDKIDSLEANVQLHDGKVIAVAELDVSIAVRMANAKRRIAAVLSLLGDQFGSTSFSARGSKRSINKAVKACSDKFENSSIDKSQGFKVINKLKRTRLTDPVDGKKLLYGVRNKLTQLTFSRNIISMTVEGLLFPYKVSVDFLLDKRISEPEIKTISNAVRKIAGKGFARYFIGFRLEGDTGGAYWATAHHNPKLEIKFLGLKKEAHIDFIKRAKRYQPKKGEVLIASAVVNHGLSFHVVILNRGGELFAKQYYHDGSSSEDKLFEKDGHYWKEGNSFKESYRVNNEILELHDKDGTFSSGKILEGLKN